MVAPCGLPLYCVSGYILHHAAAKIKRFIRARHGVPAASRLPASLLLLRWRSQRPPLVHGDRLPTDGGIQGEVSPLACLWPLPGDYGFKAPRRGCGAGACALISIQEKSAVGGQTATGAGRASVPPLSLSLKDTRRASGGVSRRAVRAPGSAARQVPG